MTILDQLPDELISLILNHIDDKIDLYACTLTNRVFYREAMPFLWRQLDIHEDVTFTKIITSMTTSKTTPGIHVRSASLHVHLFDTTLLSFIQHVPLLERLTIAVAYRITDTSFQQVPRYCPHLTYLDLHHSTESITKVSMEALGQHCHQLEEVSLFHCGGGDDAQFYLYFFATLAYLQCPIKKIRIQPYKMSAHAIERFANIVGAGFQQHLVSLELYNMFDDYTPFLVTANAHQWTWPHLTQLSFYATDGDDALDDHDTILIPFLQRHPRLTYFGVTNGRITDPTLDAIWNYLPEINQVVLSNCRGFTATGLCRMVKNCARLKKGVSIAGCDIHVFDTDFPDHLLDPRFYKTRDDDYYDDVESEEEERDDDQVVRLAGDAFDDGHLLNNVEQT